MEEIALLFFELQMIIDIDELLEFFGREEVLDAVVKIGLCVFFH